MARRYLDGMSSERVDAEGVANIVQAAKAALPDAVRRRRRRRPAACACDPACDVQLAGGLLHHSLRNVKPVSAVSSGRGNF